MLDHNEYPTVSGDYPLTDEWAVTLPSTFQTKIEDEDLVIWKSGLTIWCSVWDIDYGETQQDAMAWVVEEQAEKAFDVHQTEKDGLIFYRYRLFEETNDYSVASVYCFVFSHSSYIQLGIYVDDEADYAQAIEICESMTFINMAVLH
ncbi:hypothetical protein A1OQ_11525 [Enterovibrio norvegicus FF-162]|uniref:hypothetical protein n=1 Tax=Enterovibrio norvegicus TaxID=188144 RepID=UPI00031B678D|nr:hypothetical protein [Enterovibrio norvegicus]OEE89598.1 hypothetical protein A1OQ_11525 [Enterovibrio norvegicus FF-162]